MLCRNNISYITTQCPNKTDTPALRQTGSVVNTKNACLLYLDKSGLISNRIYFPNRWADSWPLYHFWKTYYCFHCILKKGCQFFSLVCVNFMMCLDDIHFSLYKHSSCFKKHLKCIFFCLTYQGNLLLCFGTVKLNQYKVPQCWSS